ncbi:hypothetical protein CHISP_2508 [Chitinispirillum alkaliphilum]|nr:hypothetical protein CHISP_2508 [Chitinispirillum alkaliphilum]
MEKTIIIAIVSFLWFLCSSVTAEPVVLTGEMLPELIGSSISSVRITRMDGVSLPFQIDEMNERGEYILPSGDEPNAHEATGKLKAQDEIVFLWDDTDSLLTPSVDLYRSQVVTLSRGSTKRAVIISTDTTVEKSPVTYIRYDHKTQSLKTPYFYADFAMDRFHFNRAGVLDFETGEFIDLTEELRVDILFRALWGLIPIRYDEENIVCVVRRYKVGPVRLIRRGDFHLNLGMGVKGSRAAVDQICYPQMVKVPVNVHVPFRFRSFFSQAYIEMTPVMGAQGNHFTFKIPQIGFARPFSAGTTDTLLELNPDQELFTVTNGSSGYGWLLQTTMDSSLLEGSGFVFRKPSSRGGIGESGYRLTVRNVPRGYYHIVNWVIFSTGSRESIAQGARALSEPVKIFIDNRTLSGKLNTLRSVLDLEDDQ